MPEHPQFFQQSHLLVEAVGVAVAQDLRPEETAVLEGEQEGLAPEDLVAQEIHPTHPHLKAIMEEVPPERRHIQVVVGAAQVLRVRMVLVLLAATEVMVLPRLLAVLR